MKSSEDKPGWGFPGNGKSITGMLGAVYLYTEGAGLECFRWDGGEENRGSFIMVRSYSRSHPFHLELNMAKDGWSPTTLTLSDEVIHELEHRRNRTQKHIGKVADAALRLVFFPESEPPMDHTEVLSKISECIRLHWKGERSGFLAALSDLMGKQIRYTDLNRWIEKKNIPDLELGFVETLLAVTNHLPKP